MSTRQMRPLTAIAHCVEIISGGADGYAFRTYGQAPNAPLQVIASFGGAWEHASVTILGAWRTPMWSEMCEVRNLLWPPECCVMQLHPPRSQYKNLHPHCLHLWRPLEAAIPLPPACLV